MRKGLLLLLILLLGIFFVYCYKQIRFSKFITNDFRTTVVFNTQPLLIVSFAKDLANDTIAVTVPDELSVQVPYGYGWYQVQAIWGLSELEKKPELLADTAADLLGVPVTGWVAHTASQKFPENNLESVAGIKSMLSMSSLFGTDFQTNLNTLDKLLVTLKLIKLNTNKTRLYVLHENETIFVPVKLPDGSTGKSINESALDTFLEQKFERAEVREQGLLIKVYNATQTPRVGYKFARFITNYGGKVLLIDNIDEAVERCSVTTTSQAEEGLLVDFVIETFACTKSVSNEPLDADVIVKVGDVYGTRWQL